MSKIDTLPILRSLSRRLSFHWGKALGISKFLRLIIDTNNYCNLHCEWCIVNVGRRFEVKIGDIQTFCKLFKGIGERSEHRLVGGESTMMPISTLEKIIDVFAKYNRNLTLLTNGYNLLGLPDEYLQKFSKIILDDHDINHFHVLNCKSYLDKLGIISKVRFKQIHYNLKEGIDLSFGGCRSWIASLTLSQRVIYPCCNMPALERYHKDPRIKQELIEAGWSLTNPNLAGTIMDWRQTLPQYLYDVCHHNCWQPNLMQAQYYRITKKKNDVIAYMEGCEQLWQIGED